MIWASSQSCFCWLYRASPSLAAKNIINLTGIDHQWLDLEHLREDTWCPRAEKSQQDGMIGGAKLHLESNPISTRDAQRVQTKLVCTSTQRLHRDWDRTVFECLLQRWGSAVACCGGRGSGCSRPGCGMSPPGGGRHYPTIELPELTHDWETDSWRAQTEPCVH